MAKLQYQKPEVQVFSSSEIGDVITMSCGLQGGGKESGWEDTSPNPGEKW